MRLTIVGVVIAFALMPMLPAHAQQAATGRWMTVDDATGKAKGIVEIFQARDGTYAGRVVEVLDTGHGENPLCVKCSGANKDKPILGMVTLWGLKPDGVGHWSGGRVLDPENGKTYKSKLDLLDGGRKLGMSGCVGFFCRQQVWVRR